MKKRIPVCLFLLIAAAVAASPSDSDTVEVSEELTPQSVKVEEVSASDDRPEYHVPATEYAVYTGPAPEEEILAKLVWGEARGCSATEQAAVVWCVLNRVDDGQGDIVEVATAPSQFVGYDPDNPVEPSLLSLVQDVLDRWYMETTNSGEVGRVLPEEYLFFTGNGTSNVFRTEYMGGDVWDWSLPSPYEEGAL